MRWYRKDDMGRLREWFRLYVLYAMAFPLTVLFGSAVLYVRPDVSDLALLVSMSVFMTFWWILAALTENALRGDYDV